MVIIMYFSRVMAEETTQKELWKMNSIVNCMWNCFTGTYASPQFQVQWKEKEYTCLTGDTMNGVAPLWNEFMLDTRNMNNNNQKFGINPKQVLLDNNNVMKMLTGSSQAKAASFVALTCLRHKENTTDSINGNRPRNWICYCSPHIQSKHFIILSQKLTQMRTIWKSTGDSEHSDKICHTLAVFGTVYRLLLMLCSIVDFGIIEFHVAFTCQTYLSD